MWKSIPETANLEEFERKITLENKLIDTGDILPDEVHKRDEETVRKQLLGINMETIVYRNELQRKLKDNPMTKEQAKKTIDWAFSGNKECYKLLERDTLDIPLKN